MWKDPVAAQAFRRELCWHVVPLVVAARVAGQVQQGVYTGFFFVHRDRVAWVTAAHCIEDEEDGLRTLAARDDVEWLGAWWHDHYPSSSIDAARIPVEVPALIEASTVGAGDVAVVVPRENDIQLLTSNPQFRPLMSIATGDFDDYPADGLLVVGFPGRWCKQWSGEDSESVTHFVRSDAVCLPAQVLSTDEYREGPFWEHGECLYATVRLPDARPVFELDSIKGVSGGPVFGVREQDKDRVVYAPVGLQSAWLRDSRVIRVEPLAKVIQLFENIATP